MNEKKYKSDKSVNSLLNTDRKQYKIPKNLHFSIGFKREISLLVIKMRNLSFGECCEGYIIFFINSSSDNNLFTEICCRNLSSLNFFICIFLKSTYQIFLKKFVLKKFNKCIINSPLSKTT